MTGVTSATVTGRPASRTAWSPGVADAARDDASYQDRSQSAFSANPCMVTPGYPGADRPTLRSGPRSSPGTQAPLRPALAPC